MKPLALAIDGTPRRALAYAEGGRVVELAVKKHDYAALKPRLDALEAASLEALRDALSESRDALVARVRKASDFAALANDLKRLPRFGAVEMEVRGMLDRAREAGRKDLRREVRESRSFAFDPNQPRAPKGSEDGGQWEVEHTYYHGTTEAAIQSIKEKGLVPGESKGASEWAKKHGWKSISKVDIGDRAASVFLTQEKDAAVNYARYAAEITGARPLLITIDLSSRGFGPGPKLVQDERDPLAVRLRGSILPSRILSVEEVAPGKPSLVGYGLTEFVYAVLLVKTNDQRDFADSSFKPKSALRWLRATAFWVSGILGDRVLADVKGIILNGLKVGTAGSVMAEQILDAFLPWLGDPDVIRDEQQLQPWRLETIVRTNTTTAYNHGRLSEIVDPEIARFVKGIRYSAILDERTTPVCEFLDGKVFKPSDPNLEALLPPNHYNCRSIVVPIVAGEQVDASEFITPEQIGRARGLSDAKFLTQASEAWKAYSERDDEATVEKPRPKRKPKKATEFIVAKQADGALKITRTEVPDGEV